MTGWPNLTDTELAWLAGIIEGEANFGMYRAKTRWTKRPTKYFYLEITNSDVKLIQYLEQLLGNKAVLKKRKKEWGDNPERCKPCWRITISNKKAKDIIEAVLPFMKGGKKEKAEKCLREYYDRMAVRR